ncbi:MAG: hypothetical protein KJ767_01175 [Nanoarchaeota archaeon]|nr:hypothetical protein [Nanoarchaeota archaeon]
MILERENPLSYKNPKAQYFSDLWWQQGAELKEEQKDELAFVYLENIVGVSKEFIQKFMDKDVVSNYFMGMLNAGVLHDKNDYSTFWEEVAKITPEEYSKEDIHWLIKNSQEEGCFHIIHQLDRNI